MSPRHRVVNILSSALWAIWQVEGTRVEDLLDITIVIEGHLYLALCHVNMDHRPWRTSLAHILAHMLGRHPGKGGQGRTNKWRSPSKSNYGNISFVMETQVY